MSVLNREREGKYYIYKKDKIVYRPQGFFSFALADKYLTARFRIENMSEEERQNYDIRYEEREERYGL